MEQKEVYVLIKVKPKYTREFCMMMVAFVAIFRNEAEKLKDFAKIDDIYCVLGPYDFLLKITENSKKKTEEEIHNSVNRTILKIRETLGNYIDETLTLTKFKIPITKVELGDLIQKSLKNKDYLPRHKGGKVPDERSDDEIDLEELFNADTSYLEKLIENSANFLEVDELHNQLVKLSEEVKNLKK